MADVMKVFGPDDAYRIVYNSGTAVLESRGEDAMGAPAWSEVPGMREFAFEMMLADWDCRMTAALLVMAQEKVSAADWETFEREWWEKIPPVYWKHRKKPWKTDNQ
jgi:hypothetical protein